MFVARFEVRLWWIRDSDRISEFGFGIFELFSSKAERNEAGASQFRAIRGVRAFLLTCHDGGAHGGVRQDGGTHIGGGAHDGGGAHNISKTRATGIF